MWYSGRDSSVSKGFVLSLPFSCCLAPSLRALAEHIPTSLPFSQYPSTIYPSLPSSSESLPLFSHTHTHYTPSLAHALLLLLSCLLVFPTFWICSFNIAVSSSLGWGAGLCLDASLRPVCIFFTLFLSTARTHVSTASGSSPLIFHSFFSGLSFSH